MEFVLYCLSAIQVIFIGINIFVTLFFRVDRSVVHQTITSAIIIIAYALEAILNVISNQSFVWQIILALLWVFNFYCAVRRYKYVNKKIKELEDERKNQL